MTATISLAYIRCRQLYFHYSSDAVNYIFNLRPMPSTISPAYIRCRYLYLPPWSDAATFIFLFRPKWSSFSSAFVQCRHLYLRTSMPSTFFRLRPLLVTCMFRHSTMITHWPGRPNGWVMVITTSRHLFGRCQASVSRWPRPLHIV